MRREKITVLASIILLFALLCGCQRQTGWVEENGNTYYYLEDGTAASGWQEIDGSRYHFSDDGRLEKGFRIYLERGGIKNGYIKTGSISNKMFPAPQ